MQLEDIEEEKKEGLKSNFTAKLPDNSILKMLELSMEEMIIFEVNLAQRPSDQPFLEFKEVFRKYLL